MRLTFDMECSDLAAHGVGVDGASIRATVATSYFTDEQVPLFQIRSHDVEPRVVDDSSLLICQRERVLIEPRYLHAIIVFFVDLQKLQYKILVLKTEVLVSVSRRVKNVYCKK